MILYPSMVRHQLQAVVVLRPAAARSFPLLVIAALCCSISSLLLPPQLAHGAPITPPDLTACQPAVASPVGDPSDVVTFHCCLPLPAKDPVDFSFHKDPPVKRIRRPAHKVSEDYIQKYNKAYELMKALPSEDPRSFAKQADTHCAFCNGAYKQPGNNVTLQVHFSWLFLPWHRWYLYFHERILASLLGDPDFALVFWNWDNQKGGNVLPAFFNREGTAVYDAKRNPDHLPPSLVRLVILDSANDTSEIVSHNLNAMYKTVVTASTAELFMGGPYRLGTNTFNSTVIDAPIAGQLESQHNAIHYWTGDPRQNLSADMGVFTTAARDPIFYAHHSNIDRLWNVWKTLPGGRRQDHTDPDFLNAEFVFYDENANLVKVRARDALDSEKLGIRYERVKGDKLWINYSPQAASSGSAAATYTSTNVTEIGPASENQKSIKISKKLSGLVNRPVAPSQELLRETGVKSAEQLEEVLILQGVNIPRETYVQLRVFINMPDANKHTKTSGAEYVGTFNVIPYAGESKHLFSNVKFEVGDNIQRIGIENAEKVIITIVVVGHAHDVDVSIEGMKIEFE